MPEGLAMLPRDFEIVAALALALCQGAATQTPCSRVQQAAGVVPSENRIPGQYLVILDDLPAGQAGGPSASFSTPTRSILGVARLESISDRVMLVRGTDHAAVVELAEQMPAVRWIEEVGATEVFEPTPLWNLDVLDGTRDQDIARRADGQGVEVWVVDTGVDPHHPEFEDRLLTTHTVLADDEPQDDEGHGTHVAATIAGRTVGVAPRAWLHSVRIFRNKAGTTADMVAGIEYVTERATLRGRPAVANLSGGGPYSSAVVDAICRSVAAGIPWVVAAGNADQDAVTITPAAIAPAITVGAMDTNHRMALFSNWGPTLDVWAPGEEIRSAKRGGGFEVRRGTSMATPHVTGLIAQCLARNLGASRSRVEDCLMVPSRGTPPLDLKLGVAERAAQAKEGVVSFLEALGLGREPRFEEIKHTTTEALSWLDLHPPYVDAQGRPVDDRGVAFASGSQAWLNMRYTRCGLPHGSVVAPVVRDALSGTRLDDWRDSWAAYDYAFGLGCTRATRWSERIQAFSGARFRLASLEQRTAKTVATLPCTDCSHVATFHDDRFRVSARFEGPADPAPRDARIVVQSSDSVLFSFAVPTTWELVVKVIDGCSFNGHFWVFAAGLTNQAVVLTVRDEETGEERSWRTGQGEPFPAIQEIVVFGCGQGE